MLNAVGNPAGYGVGLMINENTSQGDEDDSENTHTESQMSPQQQQQMGQPQILHQQHPMMVLPPQQKYSQRQVNV